MNKVAHKCMDVNASEKRRECGQSTVEAAFVLPILLGGVLMLVQPGIVLYDRAVMQSAVGELCRLTSTLDSSDREVAVGFFHRRMAAIPQQDCFHVHDDGACSYDIEITGDEASEEVTVSLTNKLKPLPLIDFACRAVGATDEDGCWTVRVEATMPTQPDWARSSTAGSDPESWVGDWL